MTEEDTVGVRIIRIAAAHPILNTQSRKDLAKTFGVSYETLRKWVSGQAAPSRKRAESIASRMGVRAETFMHGVVYHVHSVQFVNEGNGKFSVAQAVSPESLTSTPQSRPQAIKWRSREMIKDHPQFSVTVPDDSMAPILLKGMTAEFDSGPAEKNEIRKDEVVLVEDSSGDWYIRTYSEVTSKRWQAVPTKGVPLESDRDGLIVLAVLTGSQGRRG